MLALFENRIFLTFLLIVLAWLIKAVITKAVKSKAKKDGTDKRYVVNHARNFISLLMLVCVFAIWTPEIQQFAISIAAFVVAIVLATRELIQCFIGFIYIASAAPFRVGDWIQVGDTIGEVAGTDWAKVSLLEIDGTKYSYTGRSVFIPNNQLMTQTVKNLNYMRRYVNHTFTITRDMGCFNPFDMKAGLLEKATAYCADFSDVAERYNALIEKRLDVAISGPRPKVSISTTDLGRVTISFSLFCPTEKARVIEQKLTRDLFSAWETLSEKSSKTI